MIEVGMVLCSGNCVGRLMKVMVYSNRLVGCGGFELAGECDLWV